MEDLDDFPNNFYPFYTQFIGQVSPSVFMSIHILTKHGKKMWKCFSPAVVNVPEPSKFKRSISYHHFSAHVTHVILKNSMLSNLHTLVNFIEIYLKQVDIRDIFGSFSQWSRLLYKRGLGIFKAERNEATRLRGQNFDSKLKFYYTN